MQPIYIEMDGKKFLLANNQFEHRLDAGTVTSVVLSGSTDIDWQIGTAVTLVIYNQRFSLSVIEFDYNPKTGGDTVLRLADAIYTAPPFIAEAFEETNWETILKTRFGTINGKTELLSENVPMLFVDKLTVKELLCIIAAKNNVHFGMNDAGLWLDELPSEVFEPDVSDVRKTPYGYRCKINVSDGKLPTVGSWVKFPLKLRGRVYEEPIQKSVSSLQFENEECWLEIGEPNLPKLIPSSHIRLVNAKVIETEPLKIEFTLPEKENSITYCSELYTLTAGSTRIEVPLQNGDNVLAAVPTGITDKPMVVFPYNINQVSDTFVITTENMNISAKEINING
ncbi:hypothetical protein FACS18942_09600 [Planctomycetales bacterium]|nr:hypothetical protein FACS18942_09600 [Planctomycetales bacterium]